MSKRKIQLKYCATCLVMVNVEFCVTEHIKRILKSLLDDFGIDDFFQSIPPDKQLILCDKCHKTLQDMIIFKEQAQQSLNEFKKYWSVKMHNQNTSKAVTFQSSTLTAYVTPLHRIRVKDPKDLMSDEPYPLETNKLDKESATSTNVYDSFIDVKEENDMDTIDQPEPIIEIKYIPNQEPVQNNNAAAPIYNQVQAGFSRSSYDRLNNSDFNNYVAVPSIDNKFNYNYVPRVTNNVDNNNDFNLSKSTDCSYVNSYADETDLDDLENTIKSNILFKNKKNDSAIVENIATSNSNFTMNIKSQINNAATDSNYLSNTISKKIKQIFQNAGMDNGNVVLGDNKKLKIVKMDNKGNIENIGQGIMFNPAPVLEEPLDKGQSIWYVKIVPREEILMMMDERRRHPLFIEASYKCVLCVTVFPSERVAQTHKKAWHKKDAEFTCFACSCTFENINKLSSHYDIHTINSSVYHCTTCEFETGDSECIQMHVCPNAGSKRLPPTDPLTMKLSKSSSICYCPKCKYICTRRSQLTVHYNIQHASKPKVKCDKCGKLYKNKFGLRFHIRTVHKEQLRKPRVPLRLRFKP